MVVDGADCDGRDGVTTGVARLVQAYGVQSVDIRVLAEAFLEAGKYRARVGDDAKGTGGVGCLRGPPIGDFALEGRVVFEHERVGCGRPEGCGLENPVIKVLAQYGHAFAVAVGHRTVHLFHPDACGGCQHTFNVGVGADDATEHALHVGRFEVGDGCCTVIGKGEPIAFGTKAAVCGTHRLDGPNWHPAGHRTSDEEQTCKQQGDSVVHGLHRVSSRADRSCSAGSSIATQTYLMRNSFLALCVTPYPVSIRADLSSGGSHVLLLYSV